MAWSKIVGFEVRPVTADSSRYRRRVPLVRSPRVMLSSQRLWPMSWSFWVAFMVFLLAGPQRVGLGLHFQDDFQFDRRTEWKARDTKDKARREGLFAEDISEQLRRRIGHIRVIGELRRGGHVH